MFNLDELSALRGALNYISVQGSDVQRIAMLQMKIENIMSEIQSGPETPAPQEEKNKKNE